MFLNVILAILLVSAGPRAAVPPQQVLARMEKAASSFHSMTAKVSHTTHTAVINDDRTETGTLKMRKLGANEVQGLIDFTKPDRRILSFEKRKFQIYTPASNTVQVYDLGKYREQLDQFLMVGFGTSRVELERNYKIAVKGSEKVQDQQTTLVELVPLAKEAQQYVKRMDLWIPDESGYPVQEKLNEPSGDFILEIYSDVKINPPLKDSDLQLHLPKDVQYLYPQK